MTAGSQLSAVLAGLAPAIHVLFEVRQVDVDSRNTQTSLRSLRKLDRAAGHDETESFVA